MKYSAKKYAIALVDSAGAKHVDDKKVAANFLNFLQKNGDLKKSRVILMWAEKLLLQKTGNKKVVLATARKIDVEKLIKPFIKKGDMLRQEINPALVAGVKIMVDGQKQLDMSLSHKLNNIF